MRYILKRSINHFDTSSFTSTSFSYALGDTETPIQSILVYHSAASSLLAQLLLLEIDKI
jgi:hypothetical protein